jgi:hypothetical protein
MLETKDGRRIAIVLLACIIGIIGYLVYGLIGMFMGYIATLCFALIMWAAGKSESE